MGSGSTGHNRCGHFGIDRRLRFQVSLGMAGRNAIDALTEGGLKRFAQ
jgi:hypothetical protein